MMKNLVRDYLEFARGEKKFSLWSILIPLGLLTRFIVRIRTFFYDHGILPSFETPIPVISVGNITFGGTNKTPFVEMLATNLQRSGLRVGIVSRGYGGNTLAPVLLKGNNASRDLVGDEPLLLSSRLENIPIAVSKDRIKDVDLLRREGVHLILADDAFQHRRLGRDVDIVLVDALCPFGNGQFSPSGILRETPDSVKRADIVVITKSDQVEKCVLEDLKRKLLKWVPSDKLFCSKLEITSWSIWDDSWKNLNRTNPEGLKVVAFSAIGSPDSFIRSLKDNGLVVLQENLFKDHHRFSISEIMEMSESLDSLNGDLLACTEKDIFNLPEDLGEKYRFLVPRISTVIDNETQFYNVISECLRPRIVVTSNGFGEDSIGALLAARIQKRFPLARVSGFPIVGLGEHYSRKNIEVISCPHISPTGGVIKYSARAFFQDIRAGLVKNIISQIKAWKILRWKVRTVVCVGDVYLLLQTLIGQGQVPLLVATAKTVYLTGHWKLEQFILKHRCRRVWTRDAETAQELLNSGADAVFNGNPIMDLIEDSSEGNDPWPAGSSRRILLLPGSRARAYGDVGLLLDAAVILNRRFSSSFVAVVAPTLDVKKILSMNPGWNKLESEPCVIEREGVKVLLYKGSLVDAARNAEILLGLGGTANQVCAGLGVPVVSILEKGKLVQKKLLGDSELLVKAAPDALAEAAVRILSEPELGSWMSRAGKVRLGCPGALENVVEYLDSNLGWNLRSQVYSQLCSFFSLRN